MISTIIWNIRGMKSKKSFNRLSKLVNIHNVQFVAIQEPFVNVSNLDKYNRKIGFQNVVANRNGAFGITVLSAP